MLHSKYYPRDQIRSLRWTGRGRVFGREELPTEFWWGNMREGHHFKDLDLDLDGSMILKVS